MPSDSVRAAAGAGGEKTGYPLDMLDPDLDLEADLGVDTVKQADLFASVRAIYNIPRDENRKLRDFPTLAHVIRFVYEMRPDLDGCRGGIRSSRSPLRRRPPLARNRTHRSPAACRRPPCVRRSPCASRPPSRWDPAAAIAIMPDKGGVAEALAGRLRASGAEVLLLDGDAVHRPVHGVYWLPALDYEGSLTDMDLATWREALGVRLKSLYTTMRALYEQIAAPDTFLVSATRLGGQHGYDEPEPLRQWAARYPASPRHTNGSGRTRFVKTVDFEAERNAVEVAEALVAETLRDPGAVEIGYKGGLRWTISLEEQSAADGQPGIALDKDTSSWSPVRRAVSYPRSPPIWRRHPAARSICSIWCPSPNRPIGTCAPDDR
jgi:hypothetical protein